MKERLSGQGVVNALVGHRVISAAAFADDQAYERISLTFDDGAVLALEDSSYGILATLHRPETEEEIQTLTEDQP